MSVNGTKKKMAPYRASCLSHLLNFTIILCGFTDCFVLCRRGTWTAALRKDYKLKFFGAGCRKQCLLL